MSLDLDRVSDWVCAVERWRLGDPRPLAAFVLRYGVIEHAEREALAQMLTSRSDARREIKPSTRRLMRDLDAALRRRDWIESEFVPGLSAWVARLRDRLSRSGMTEPQIEAVLRRSRPGYVARLKAPSRRAVEALVAERHGIDPESLRKAAARRR